MNKVQALSDAVNRTTTCDKLGVDEPRLLPDALLSEITLIEAMTPDATLTWEEFLKKQDLRSVCQMFGETKSVVVEKNGRRYAQSSLVCLYTFARSTEMQQWMSGVVASLPRD